MKRAKVLAAGLGLIGLSLRAEPLVAQATVAADLDLSARTCGVGEQPAEE